MIDRKRDGKSGLTLLRRSENTTGVRRPYRPSWCGRPTRRTESNAPGPSDGMGTPPPVSKGDRADANIVAPPFWERQRTRCCGDSASRRRKHTRQRNDGLSSFHRTDTRGDEGLLSMWDRDDRAPVSGAPSAWPGFPIVVR